MHVNVLIIFAFLMVWTTIEGLTLKPASDLTLQNFSLVCDLDGVSWSSPVQFTYGPNSGGGCGTPPNPRCVSSIGTITASNDQIITLKLFQSNIASLGEQTWTCSHGSVSVDYNATLIAVCSDGQVKQIGDEVDIRCSCGFPDVKATLKYKVSILQGKGPNIVDLQNSTGNCVGDSRAMDFIYRDNIPIGATELCISFTTLSQISESKEECIKIRCIDPLICLVPVILIVIIVSIIIIIIMKKKSPEKIHEKLGDFSIGKIGIIILIIIVAIVIGLGIGFGLRDGNGKCDNWGRALGLGFLCGVLLSLLLIVIIFFYSKKEKKDDRETDRSNGDRARSPASASEVKVQTGKISQNKPTERVKEETKPRPLPETPKGRKDQLEPIKPDDGEVENSEQKKKKKKKKKKKEPTEVEKTELQE